MAELGMIHAADERFRKNIYKYGEETAEFANQAIGAFCESN